MPGRYSGISDATRRVIGGERRYPGLSMLDDALLKRWLLDLGSEADELHTHVPIGERPVELEDMMCPRMQRMADAAWPRRIDAVLRYGKKWVLVECKPAADHHALGQVLCYKFWWQQTAGLPPLSSVRVVTDACDRDCRTAFAHFGVMVDEVGDVGFQRDDQRRLVMVDAGAFES